MNMLQLSPALRLARIHSCKRAFAQLALMHTRPLRFQGIVTNLAVALRYGWLGLLSAKPDPPISCTGDAWLLWSGTGALLAFAFLRVYRSHKVLIRHNSVMWPVSLQLGLVLLPFLFPPAFLTARPDLLESEEDTQECERHSEVPEAFALTFCLRAVRFQVRQTFSSAKVIKCRDYRPVWGLMTYRTHALSDCRRPLLPPLL